VILFLLVVARFWVGFVWCDFRFRFSTVCWRGGVRLVWVSFFVLFCAFFFGFCLTGFFSDFGFEFGVFWVLLNSL
jgi:hypothetical protein